MTQRDIDVYDIMREFNGKTFANVLSQTGWLHTKNSIQQAKNRLTVMRKKKLISFKKTGLLNPRNVVVMTQKGRDEALKYDIEVNYTNFTTNSIQHMINEQIAYYWLKKVGKNVKRTVVQKWSENHAHTPDLVYQNDEKMIYVEIEMTKKSEKAYFDIFEKNQKDNVYAVVYVFEDEKSLNSISKKFPKMNNVFLTTIENLIFQCSTDGKFKPKRMEK